MQEDECAPLWELNPIWNKLSDEQKVTLNNQIEIVRYNKNDIIHLDGEKSQYMWTLISGKVRIYKEGISQRQQIIRLLKPYDIFGYRAVIAEEPYNSSANAIEPCVIARLNADCFNQMIRAKGDFCYAILVMMATDLAISEIRTVNLTQKHIRGRLAEALLNIAEKYGLEPDGKTLAMLVPREDLANMSNMTTSNAIRTLSQFSDEELIDVDGRRIRLLNREELEHISRIG